MADNNPAAPGQLEAALQRIIQLEAAHREAQKTISELVGTLTKSSQSKQSELQKLVINKVPMFNCERSVEAVTSFRRDFKRAVEALGMEADQSGQMTLFLAKLGENAQKWKEVRESDAAQVRLTSVAEWLEEIQKVFYPQDDADRAREEFSLLKQKAGEKVNEFVTRLNTLLLRLPPKADEDVAVAFVNGLSEPAGSIVGIQRMTEIAKGGKLTFAQLAQIASQVKAEQSSRPIHLNQIQTDAEKAKRKRKDYGDWSVEQQDRYRRQQCFHCGEEGHKRVECPLRLKRAQLDGKKEPMLP